MERKNIIILFFYISIWLLIGVLLLIYGEERLALDLNANPSNEAFIRFIIFMTDSLYYIIGIVGILTLISLFIPKAEKFRTTMITTVFTYAVTFGITYGLKIMIARPRPYTELGDTINTFGKHPHDYSMPSGHSSYSAAITIPIALKIKNAIAIILLISYNLILMYSRIYLGVHWMGDILVGSILGAILSYLMVFIFDRLYSSGKISTYKSQAIIGTIGVVLVIITALLA